MTRRRRDIDMQNLTDVTPAPSELPLARLLSSQVMCHIRVLLSTLNVAIYMPARIENK